MMEPDRNGTGWWALRPSEGTEARARRGRPGLRTGRVPGCALTAGNTLSEAAGRALNKARGRASWRLGSLERSQVKFAERMKL